ncbi:alpha/beta fold hydrolase [Peribacillus glennii]|uniref:Alpha/beta fold hydrolase n=1 Tax=Peribacillus glennii TaxID=2303991 RepID=A0A372LFI0_9BACI|nr:alpha/beta fold hydrolase [Peribacillus glennii]RFU64829.1 alpha/beta fold hydrolase [Peribacillus glennii]
MIENPYYTQKNHGPYEIYNLGDFKLEDGGIIPDCKLAYVTFGELNETKDNAILILTWYGGTNKIMETYIGSENALNPDKYFIIIINQIGNGLSSSPHNTPAPMNMGNFPKVRIADDVRAQHKLLTEKFAIEELALVAGASMGAQQTYEWAVRFPDMVKRAAPIAGTAKNTPHNCLYTDTLMEAITSDPNWNNGNYRSSAEVVNGLNRHAKIWGLMGCSTEFYKQEAWRLFGVDSLEQFISDFLQAIYKVRDPNALLCMGWKWQHSDVSRNTNGNLKAAFERVKAKVYVMPIDEDMFFPPKDCEEEQKMIPNSELRVIRSICGHYALFGAEGRNYMHQINNHLNELLSSQV